MWEIRSFMKSRNYKQNDSCNQKERKYIKERKEGLGNRTLTINGS